MTQISCRDLSLGYEGHAVVRDLSFTVSRGDYLCVLGANGSGKSTLMKTLLNLIPPIAGSITLSDGLTRQDIGYLPQRTEAQKDFPASVREVVMSGFAGKNRGLRRYTAEQKAAAAAHMARLGIEPLANQSFRTLSGGQQQRVLLCRALCAAERLLLLDEPVSGLDPEATEQMYNLIASLNREGITVIMISHDLSAALHHATHVLDVGRTPPFFGTREAYLTQREEERHVGI